uniref:Uncharacterized protein n=1 Tax=Megaselia scalaris TaxID=36166 RepID=T1GGP1_MEGSC
RGVLNLEGQFLQAKDPGTVISTYFPRFFKYRTCGKIGGRKEISYRGRAQVADRGWNELKKEEIINCMHNKNIRKENIVLCRYLTQPPPPEEDAPDKPKQNQTKREPLLSKKSKSDANVPPMEFDFQH